MSLLKTRFRKVLLELAPKLTENDFEQINELIDVGELKIGLENLCIQLFEYDAKCSKYEIEEISIIGSILGVRERYWIILDSSKN